MDILKLIEKLPAELTVGELRAYVTRLTEHAACKHCGQEISRFSDGPWKHEPNDERGCRAASFRNESGWDDSLDRRWMAAPHKN